MTDASYCASHRDAGRGRRFATAAAGHPLLTFLERFAQTWTFAGLLSAALAGGCGTDAPDRPACLNGLNVDTCELAYAPDYNILFERVFAPSCTSSGGACHGSGGGQGGLVFLEEAASHADLLAPKPGGARVKPGDAACSELVVRLDSIGHSWSMPPATPLDEGQRCSIRRWIQAGATRAP
jgi:hypothetical protein